MKHITMNGFTNSEIDTKKIIQELIRLGGIENCDKAREISNKFLSKKRAKRIILLRTIKNWVSVMNGLNIKEKK